jgi:hypothetical protein
VWELEVAQQAQRALDSAAASSAASAATTTAAAAAAAVLTRTAARGSAVDHRLKAEALKVED